MIYKLLISKTFMKKIPKPLLKQNDNLQNRKLYKLYQNLKFKLTLKILLQFLIKRSTECPKSEANILYYIITTGLTI